MPTLLGSYTPNQSPNPTKPTSQPLFQSFSLLTLSSIHYILFPSLFSIQNATRKSLFSLNPLKLSFLSLFIPTKMNPNQNPIDPDHPQLPTIKIHHPSSPRHPHHHSAATPTPTAGARRKIGVAVDLSDESAYAVRWAVNHYIRPGDAVILLHVSPTSVLFGADWGPLPQTPTNAPQTEFNSNNSSNEDSRNDNQRQQQMENDFDAFTASKAADFAKPLKEANIPYKIHIVKDHDMKERLCLEVERLGLSAVIMGSRGFGAAKRGSDGRLGSVSDYCVHHCVCPVVVVRYPDDKDGGGTNGEGDAVVNVPVEDDDEEEVVAADVGNRKG